MRTNLHSTWLILGMVAAFSAAACSDDKDSNGNGGGTDTGTITDTGNEDTGTPDEDTGGGGDATTEDTGAPEDTGGPGDSTSTDTSTEDTGTTQTATCEEYCTTVMANCTGDNTQYGSNQECLDYCNNVAAWEQGNDGATDGNSIACRTYHAGAPAQGAPALHCPHAGPTGGGVCGTWCENYCHLAMKNCTGANSLWADGAACATGCETISDEGKPGDVKFDTIQCRLYHVGAPAFADAGTHCSHAGANPTDFCIGDPAEFQFATALPTDYVKKDRMGMPAVATVLIKNKSDYNTSTPEDDVAFKFAAEILESLTALHTALDDDLVGLGLTPCSMEDTDKDGLPNCADQEVAPGLPVVSLVVPDTLKIDPTAPAGFPNGRRLADPVVDITLSVIMLDLTTHAANALVGVNPKTNDKGVEGAFLSEFPYVHPPHTP